MRVGFIGIGNIGKPMAEQVVRAGHELVVHDLNRDAAESLVAEGAVWAESPSEVAAECDVVCTCLPGPNEVEPLVLSGGGIAASIRPGSVYVDHTTNAPSLVRRISDLLATKGVDTLDAPVSGGMEGARTRDLVMLVGGDAAVVEKVRPVLDSMAKTVMHVGDVGAGCVCKHEARHRAGARGSAGCVAHNCAGFSINLAMVECMTLAVKAGVDPTTLVNVFQQAAIGRSFDLQVRLPATLFQGDFEPRFALKVANKDMRLAIELAQSLGIPMKLAEASAEQMSEAMTRGLGDRDSSVFLTLQEERAGAKIRT